MTLTWGYVKDLDLKLPLRNQIKFTDPRTGEKFDGWCIAVDELTPDQKPVIYQDCKTRFDDIPPESEFWLEVLAQRGLPIRADRVSVVHDLRGFI